MPARPIFLNDETDLISRIRKGDRKALLRLFDENRRPVGSLVTKNGGNSDDVDDILQESIIIAWERIRAGAYEPAARLGTFVYGIAKRLWLRRLARSRKQVPGLDGESRTASDDPSGLDLLLDREQDDILAKAIRRLDEACRTLLLLFYWERLPLEEIGRLLGFANADTVKARKYQCKERLKELAKIGAES